MVTVDRFYRDAGGATTMEIYRNGALRASEHGFADRKAYITTKFEGKFKKRDLSIG